jgi:glutathione S-transferase
VRKTSTTSVGNSAKFDAEMPSRLYSSGRYCPGGQPVRDAIEAALPAVLQSLTVLDRAVAESGYLAGGQFTLADLYPLPVLAYLQACPEGSAALERQKSLNTYFEKHSQRTSFKNTVPPSLQDVERLRAAIS